MSGDGDGSAAQGGQPLPDTMYRMSKKIAQLTKVIGMLVNKTEDNEYEMNHVHDAWEARVHELTDSTNAQVAEARRNMGADGQASHIVPTLIPM